MGNATEGSNRGLIYYPSICKEGLSKTTKNGREYGMDEKTIAFQIVDGEKRMERDHLGDLGVNGSEIRNWILEIQGGQLRIWSCVRPL
jgi:hypothetical protein